MRWIMRTDGQKSRIDGQTDIQKERQKDRKTARWIMRTDGQKSRIDVQTDRQKDKKIERQRDG